MGETTKIYDADWNLIGYEVRDGDTIKCYDADWNSTGRKEIDGDKITEYDKNWNKVGHSRVEGDKIINYDDNWRKTGISEIRDNKIINYNSDWDKIGRGAYGSLRKPSKELPDDLVGDEEAATEDSSDNDGNDDVSVGDSYTDDLEVDDAADSGLSDTGSSGTGNGGGLVVIAFGLLVMGACVVGVIKSTKADNGYPVKEQYPKTRTVKKVNRPQGNAVSHLINGKWRGSASFSVNGYDGVAYCTYNLLQNNMEINGTAVCQTRWMHLSKPELAEEVSIRGKVKDGKVFWITREGRGVGTISESGRVMDVEYYANVNAALDRNMRWVNAHAQLIKYRLEKE